MTTPTTTTTRESFSAREADRAAALGRLMAAISVEVEAGERVPCIAPAATSHWWTSEDKEAIEAASTACLGCAALSACRKYITDHPEPSSVWGGLTPDERNHHE